MCQVSGQGQLTLSSVFLSSSERNLQKMERSRHEVSQQGEVVTIIMTVTIININQINAYLCYN